MTDPELTSVQPKESPSGFHYSFIQLDPRPGQGSRDYGFGIEITAQKLLKEGVPNLDHHGKDSTADTPSACEQALTFDLPEDGTALGTIRVDKDSLTAMAVLESRKAGRYISEELVHAVGAIDRYGPKASDRYEQFKSLVVSLDRQAANFKLPLAQRVKFAQQVLDGTVNMNEVEEMVSAANKEIEQARAASKITEIIPGKLVLVESEHRFATNLGYEVAPTIIAFNQRMPVLARTEDGSMNPTGETYAKYTIARYDDHVPTDINIIADSLRKAEAKARGISEEELKNNWGGRGDIIGSPQNESSRLTVDEVVGIVEQNLQSAKESFPEETIFYGEEYDFILDEEGWLIATKKGETRPTSVLRWGTPQKTETGFRLGGRGAKDSDIILSSDEFGRIVKKFNLCLVSGTEKKGNNTIAATCLCCGKRFSDTSYMQVAGESPDGWRQEYATHQPDEEKLRQLAVNCDHGERERVLGEKVKGILEQLKSGDNIFEIGEEIYDLVGTKLKGTNGFCGVFRSKEAAVRALGEMILDAEIKK